MSIPAETVPRLPPPGAGILAPPVAPCTAHRSQRADVRAVSVTARSAPPQSGTTFGRGPMLRAFATRDVLHMESHSNRETERQRERERERARARARALSRLKHGFESRR